MAKTIKFNLICDNQPVRTIEDLQNNFAIEDVLEYYKNELLHKWLKVHGYTEELKKVEGIIAVNQIEIIKILIKIFNVATDDKKIEESIYILKYLEDRKKQYSNYKDEEYKVKNIIYDYEVGYGQLIKGIVKNPYDIAKIKANITEMVNNYTGLLGLNYRNLFYVLKGKSSLAIMCLLMNEQMRKYYLPIENKHEDGTITSDIDSNKDKSEMFNAICDMITEADLKMKLGENLLSFSGNTNEYWKDLEPKGKKYMIINMGEGDYVRSSGEKGGDLSRKDVLNKFVIVDGIDYKSNSSTRQLLYMEV